MDKKAILLEEWISNTDRITQALARFDVESFNRKPENGGWSAGDTGEHILIFDTRLNTLLPDCTMPAARDPYAQVKPITDRLADRGNKIDAPEFLKPSGNAQDPNAIIEKIRTERSKVASAIENQDIALLNTKTPHRLFGTLTALEWIVLVMNHSDRHLKQLEIL